MRTCETASANFRSDLAGSYTRIISVSHSSTLPKKKEANSCKRNKMAVPYRNFSFGRDYELSHIIKGKWERDQSNKRKQRKWSKVWTWCIMKMVFKSVTSTVLLYSLMSFVSHFIFKKLLKVAYNLLKIHKTMHFRVGIRLSPECHGGWGVGGVLPYLWTMQYSSNHCYLVLPSFSKWQPSLSSFMLRRKRKNGAFPVWVLDIIGWLERGNPTKVTCGHCPERIHRWR